MPSCVNFAFASLAICLALARTVSAQEPKVLKNWDFHESEGWTYGNEIIDPHVGDSILEFTSAGSDPILIGPQYEPLPVSHQVAIIYAAGEGYLDDLPIDQVRAFEQYLIAFLTAHHPSLMDRLERGDWSRRVRRALPEAIGDSLAAFTSAPSRTALSSTAPSSTAPSSTGRAPTGPSPTGRAAEG